MPIEVESSTPIDYVCHTCDIVIAWSVGLDCVQCQQGKFETSLSSMGPVVPLWTFDMLPVLCAGDIK